MRSFCRKTMSVKFPFFGEGLGGGVPILFLWARGFFWFNRILTGFHGIWLKVVWPPLRPTPFARDRSPPHWQLLSVHRPPLTRLSGVSLAPSLYLCLPIYLSVRRAKIVRFFDVAKRASISIWKECVSETTIGLVVSTALFARHVFWNVQNNEVSTRAKMTNYSCTLGPFRDLECGLFFDIQTFADLLFWVYYKTAIAKLILED